MRELGQDVYGFNAAIGLRVDPQDNVWTIDAGGEPGRQVRSRRAASRSCWAGSPRTSRCVRRSRPLDAEGSHKRGGRGSGAGAAAAGGGGGRAAGSGTPGSSFSQPSDVAWDRAGNIYVADGLGSNNRIAKFDKDGRFLAHWGSTGSGQGQFMGVKAIAIDAQDNVYVADMGNKRIQVFDAQGVFKSEFANVGTPRAMCMTRGSTQYLYISHAGDEDGMDDAAIYKVQLDGKVVGRFGSAGKLPKQFGIANSIDCRSDTELLVGEMTNWRVQKITLK